MHRLPHARAASSASWRWSLRSCRVPSVLTTPSSSTALRAEQRTTVKSRLGLWSGCPVSLASSRGRGAMEVATCSVRALPQRRAFTGEADEEEPRSISIPRDKIELSFSRSSGPGGQNVNKVNTKVELRFNLDEADWIPDEVKERLRIQRAGDINKEGEMVITSSVHRTQGHNLNEAYRKLKRYLDDACIVPKERIATEVPDYAIEHRLKEKKRRSEVKQNRQKPRWDE